MSLTQFQKPPFLNESYYGYIQKISDHREEELLDGAVAFDLLRNPLRLDIQGKLWIKKIKFKGIYNGISLPATFFDVSKLQSYLKAEFDYKRAITSKNRDGYLLNNKYENEGYASLYDDRAINDAIKGIADESISQIVITILTDLQDVIYEDTSFELWLRTNNTKFNSMLFWILFRLYFDGVLIERELWMACFLLPSQEFQNNGVNIVTHAMENAGRHVPTIDLSGATMYITDPKIDTYYTNYNDLMLQQSLDVVYGFTNCQIGWIVSYGCSKMIKMGVLLEKLRDQNMYCGVHSYSRVQDHVHIFRSENDAINFMWFNVYRTFNVWYGLQDASFVIKNARHTYNMAWNKTTTELFKLQVMCALPPPIMWNDTHWKTIRMIKLDLTQMYKVGRFTAIMNAFYGIPSGHKKLYVWDVIENAYEKLNSVAGKRYQDVIYKLHIGWMNKITTSMPSVIVGNKPVEWIQFPTIGNIDVEGSSLYNNVTQEALLTVDNAKMIVKSVGKLYNPKYRISAFDMNQVFSVQRYNVFADEGLDPDAYNAAIENLKSYYNIFDAFSSYRDQDANAVRHMFRGLYGNKGKLKASDFVKIICAQGEMTILQDRSSIFYASLFVENLSKIAVDNNVLLALDNDTIYLDDFNNSSIKIMTILVDILKIHGLMAYNVNVFDLSLSFMFLGAVFEPVGNALRRLSNNFSVDGIGDNAYSNYKRSSYQYTTTRKVADYVISDIDQSGEQFVTYKEVVEGVTELIEYCDGMCSKAFTIKVQYMSYIIFDICKKYAESHYYQLIIHRSSVGTKFSTERFITFDKFGYDDKFKLISTWALTDTIYEWFDFCQRVPRKILDSTIYVYEYKDVINKIMTRKLQPGVIIACVNLDAFTAILNILLNICDHVKTGKISTNTSLYLLIGDISMRRYNLLLRSSKFLSIDTPKYAIRANNIGVFNDVPSQVSVGARLRSSGAWNLATKIRVGRIIENFRCTSGIKNLRIASIGDGRYEGASYVGPDDDYLIVDPISLPGASIHGVDHLKKTLTDAVKEIEAWKPNVIVATFVLFYEFGNLTLDNAALIEFLTRLFSDENACVIVNYYMDTGLKMMSNLTEQVGYHPRDMSFGWTQSEGNKITRISLKGANKPDCITFGSYTPIYVVKETSLMEIKDLHFHPVTMLDVQESIVKFNVGVNTYLLNNLILYNKICPLMSNITPELDWNVCAEICGLNSS